MAETVYIVPGLAESVLANGYNAAGTRIVPYPDVAGFLLGSFGKLRLAANGTDPGPPDGVTCTATDVLGPYVGFPALQLQTFSDSALWNFQTYAWDWRKSIFTAGDALAAMVAANTPSGQQCSLIGHSAGGMVCRRAWYTLGQNGQQGLIRRIITLGTPHYGSYFVVYAWSGGSTFLLTMQQWNAWAGETIIGISQVTGYVAWTLPEVLTLSQTWPALYELMPIIGAPDATGDPNRPLLFQSANWGGDAIPSQAWLDHARNVYQPWALNPASMPPQQTMLCVASTPQGAVYGLVDPSQLGTGAALGYASAGDGIVTQASAQPATASGWNILSMHQDQLPDSVNNGNIIAWLTMPLAPAPTPPIEGTSNTTNTANLAPVPFAPPVPMQPSFGPFGVSGSGGDC